MGKASHSVCKSSGHCFVQQQYPDDSEQSRQEVENITKCSVYSTIKKLKDVGVFSGEIRSRWSQVIGERLRSKCQIAGFVRLDKSVIRKIAISEIDIQYTKGDLYDPTVT